MSENLDVIFKSIKLECADHACSEQVGHLKKPCPTDGVAQDDAGFVAIEAMILTLFIGEGTVFGFARVVPIAIDRHTGAFGGGKKVVFAGFGKVGVVIVLTAPGCAFEHDIPFETRDHAKSFGVEDNGVIFLSSQLDGDPLKDSDVSFGPEAKEGIADEGAGVHRIPPAQLWIRGDLFFGDLGSSGGGGNCRNLGEKPAEDKCS